VFSVVVGSSSTLTRLCHCYCLESHSRSRGRGGGGDVDGGCGGGGSVIARYLFWRCALRAPRAECESFESIQNDSGDTVSGPRTMLRPSVSAAMLPELSAMPRAKTLAQRPVVTPCRRCACFDRFASHRQINGFLLSPLRRKRRRRTRRSFRPRGAAVIQPLEVVGRRRGVRAEV